MKVSVQAFKARNLALSSGDSRFFGLGPGLEKAAKMQRRVGGNDRMEDPLSEELRQKTLALVSVQRNYESISRLMQLKQQALEEVRSDDINSPGVKTATRVRETHMLMLLSCSDALDAF